MFIKEASPFISISFKKTTITMDFLSSQFAIDCATNYDLAWALEPIVEPSRTLLKYHNKQAANFYDLIRRRSGEKIFIEDFVAVGLILDEVYTLFLLVALKQIGSIYIGGNSNVPFIVYQSQSSVAV